MRTLLATILLAGAAATTALCDDADFHWQGQLAPGQILIVRGVLGAIRASGTSGSTASLTAHKTATDSDPSAVSIRVVPFDGGVVVCAMYPDGDPTQPNTCNPPGMDNFSSVSNNDVQVEFTVQVPQGVQFSANTLHGDIEADSLTADVDARTNMGEINISTTGAAQATTLQGSITASIGSVNWTGLRVFETIEGDIDLQIPVDASVSLRANTVQGTLMSDFPLMVKSRPFGSTQASGTLGAGGRSLRLSVNQGNITLRQGPASGQ